MSRLIPRFTSRTRISPSIRCFRPTFQSLHTSTPTAAKPLPITAHGRPPKPPLPTGEITDMRRRQKLESVQDSASKGLSNRGKFWKEVRVVEVDGGVEIHLDTHPLKTPTKQTIIIPRSKPLLVASIVVEWNLLRTSADAQRSYLIPLTQLVSRVLDLDVSERSSAEESSGGVARREDIVENLLRYLDTDTLLCFAPTTPHEEGRKTLREMQEESARPIRAFLVTNVWPGVNLVPIDGDDGLIPVKGQPKETRDVIKSWISTLGVWDLVGLERAVLASKSLLIGARLVVEWSEEMDFSRGRPKTFGVHQAAAAASVEVRFQTGRWGEVEDTHDVEKEDLKRQLGAAMLLVSGIK